ARVEVAHRGADGPGHPATLVLHDPGGGRIDERGGDPAVEPAEAVAADVAQRDLPPRSRGSHSVRPRDVEHVVEGCVEGALAVELRVEALADGVGIDDGAWRRAPG